MNFLSNAPVSALVVVLLAGAGLPGSCQDDPFASPGSVDQESPYQAPATKRTPERRPAARPLESWDDAVTAEAGMVDEEQKGPERLWRSISTLCQKGHVAITSGHLKMAERYSLSALEQAMAYEPTVHGKDSSKRQFYLDRPMKLVERVVSAYISTGNYAEGNRLAQTLVRKTAQLEGVASTQLVRTYTSIGKQFERARQWEYALFYFANALELTKNLSTSRYLDTPKAIAQEYVRALMKLGRHKEARAAGLKYGVRPSLYQPSRARPAR